MTSPGTRTQTHTKEQHTWKTKHLTQKHRPTQNNKTNPKMNHDPAHPEGDEGMSQKLNMHTHDTQDKYLQAFYTISSQSFVATIGLK